MPGRRPALHAVRSQEIADQAAEHFAEVDRTGVSKLFIPRGVTAPRAHNAVHDGNNIDFEYRSIEDAFPDVEPGIGPLGSLVLVMIRQPMTHAGGVELQSDARKTEHDNTQIAKVIGIGPMCFRNRNTGEMWPEGAWCAVGDFVKVPKYQGDPWAIAYTRDDGMTDFVRFGLFKDLALMGRYPDAAAALAAKAFY